MFSITIEGLDEIEADWSTACRAISDGLRKGVQRAIDEGATTARTTHKFKNQTGNAERQTYSVLIKDTDGEVLGQIVCDVPYAVFLDKGTKAHDITAKKRFLAWENPDAQGDWHFARKVHHPGTKADPFMANAYRRAKSVAEWEAEVAADRAVSIMES